MRAWLPLAAAVAVELAMWSLGRANRTETFAWFRVAAHLGTGGFVLAALAGGAAAALPYRLRPPAPWALLALAALALHAAFLDVPQGQPDAVIYFTLAQHVARDPLGALLGWPGLAWSGPEARFHLPFPLVPGLLGLVWRAFGESPGVTDGFLTAWAVALPLVVAWAGARDGRPALLPAAAIGTLPLLQAQSGWLLVDLPLCVLVALAWGAMVRAQDGRGAALAALACVPALLTKVSAPLFLAGPAVALLYRHRPGLVVAFGTAALGALCAVDPPRLRTLVSWFGGLGALALHLRPALWVPALAGLRGADPFARVLLGALGAVPVVWLWSPAEHAARYGLPIAAALALAAARVAPRAVAFAAGSGLVLLLGGYRPILVHHQAENLHEAARQLEARGVRAIEVWGDLPGTSFPTAALAALVDYTVDVPVQVGGTLAQGEAEKKRRWWEFYVAPPWRAPDGTADGALLCLYGAEATAFEAAHPEWRRVGTVSLYRASSVLHPREVVLYQR